MTKISKNNENLSKFELFVLNRLPVAFFERKYKSLTDRLSKYNNYLQRKILSAHITFLLSSVPENLKDIYKTLLNTQMDVVLTDNLADLSNTRIPPKVMLNIAHHTIKYVSAVEGLVGVQPMQGPVGLVYGMEYTDNEDGTPISNVNVGEKKTSLKVVANAIECGTRQLKAGFTIEAMQDFELHHRELDFETELAKAMASEIGHEIIEEILNDLVNLAGTKRVIDDGGKDFGTLIQSGYNELIIMINEVCNEIARKTRRGAGNFIVVSPVIASLLQSSSKAVFVPATRDDGNTRISELFFVGTLNGTIKVYSSLSEHVRDRILVGYKGSNTQADTGYFYAPYVMIMKGATTISSDTFQPTVALRTRYGKLARTPFAPDAGSTPWSTSCNYYGVINISGLLGNILDFQEKATEPVDLEIGQTFLE